MEGELSWKRLDEILIEKGLITEDDIREALLHQKEEGGKLGSLLLRHRYVNEAGLVDALSTQMQCPGVVLSSLQIPPDVIERVPQDVAMARKVMPFEFDADRNTLKIACEDPADQSLVGELSFVSAGAQIELHVAAQITLDAAISKYYLGQDISIYDNVRPTILLVSDEEQTPLVQSLLQADDYDVVITASANNVIDLLEDRKFHSIFIKKSLEENSLDLADRVRRVSPATLVRCYENVSSLLFEDTQAHESDLFLKNIDLLTSLLSSKAQLPVNHSIRVARYADDLCRKLSLPDKDRLIITNAAYIHDLAMCYYGADGLEDHRQAIQLTITLLGSLDYSPEVLQILRSMYSDLPGDHATRLPREVLGGNILTAVDMVCQAVPGDQHLAFDKFDIIQRSLRDQVGTSLLAEVVDGLISMLQGRILDSHSAQGSTQVMVYSDDPNTRRLLDMRLRNEGFRTVLHSSTASLIELYHRSKPDIIILGIDGACMNVTGALDEMADAGIALEGTPTLLLTGGLSISNITTLLDRGVEDIIMRDQSLDLLVCKLKTLTARPEPAKAEVEPRTEPATEPLQEEEPKAEEISPKTQGRLADINLIDLLQILGPGRRTARVIVRPDNADAGGFTLCLDQGRIVFAATEDRVGPDAVYEALAWTDGTWEIQPACAEDFPPSNNDLSNESILMEGCRALDEKLEIEALV